jgi:hypothetical protein
VERSSSAGVDRNAVPEPIEIPILRTALFLLSCLTCPAACLASQIWLCGIAPTPQRSGEPDSRPSDYMDMFRPEAPWSRAAANVSVLKLSTRFVLTGTDNDLSAVFRDIRRRNIALAVELGVLSGDMSCGMGVEGFAYPTTATTVAQRIRRLGGDLKYVALDEQLYFGHQYDGPRSCKWPIDQVAHVVAGHMKEMRTFFPGLQVGDIEPIGSAHPNERVDEIIQWTAAYRAAMGEPLAFMHADVQWHQPWEEELHLLAQSLRSAHIKFGIIYNGDGSDTTGEAWTGHAEERLATIEADPALVPDQAILQTWMLQPEHMLPETQPGTMTYLVDRYLALPSRLTLRRSTVGLAGRLTDVTGRPIIGATVRILGAAQGNADITVVRTFSGTVPRDVASATIALRINNECDCFGPANVAIGTVTYRDDRTGQTAQRQFKPADGMIGMKPHFVAAAGQKVGQNTPAFPVSPGDPFTIEFPLWASYDSGSAGYVGIIFLDQQGKGRLLQTLPFQPSTQPIGTAVTDGSGQFSIALRPGLLSSGARFLAEFQGNGQYRLSSGFVP